MSGMLAGQAAFRALTGEETTTGVASNSIKDAVPSAPSLADAGNVTKHAGGEGEPGPAIVTPPVVTPAVTVAPVSSEASTTLGTLSADALTGTTALEQQVDIVCIRDCLRSLYTFPHKHQSCHVTF